MWTQAEKLRKIYYFMSRTIYICYSNNKNIYMHLIFLNDTVITLKSIKIILAETMFYTFLAGHLTNFFFFEDYIQNLKYSEG